MLVVTRDPVADGVGEGQLVIPSDVDEVFAACDAFANLYHPLNVQWRDR